MKKKRLYKRLFSPCPGAPPRHKLLSVVVHDPPGGWEEHGGDNLWLLQRVDNAALEGLTDRRLQVAHPGETVLPELVHDEA